jgi:hypothetical protein
MIEQLKKVTWRALPLFLVFALIIAFTLYTVSTARGDNKGKGDAGQRVLEFPSDVSVGHLMIIANNFSPQERHLVMRFFADCRGKVVVPTNITLLLKASDVLTDRAACLLKLPADALAAMEFDKTTIGDADLIPISHLTGLRYLDLEGTDTTDRGIESLGGLVNLGFLDLSHTMIKGSTIGRLAALKKLESLNIGANELTAKAIEALGSLHPASLQRLDVSRCHINDSELPDLAKLSNLFWLELQDNSGITDRGLNALRPLKKLSNLDLRQTAVTVKGLLALHGLPLKTVALSCGRALAADQKALQQAFPGIMIGYDHRDTAMPKDVFAPLH